jgi:DNA-nicking Smr family endonuclease
MILAPVKLEDVTMSMLQNIDRDFYIYFILNLDLHQADYDFTHKVLIKLIDSCREDHIDDIDVDMALDAVNHMLRKIP